MHHNTFTYRHSDLPPVRPEIYSEIVALDVWIADLILKSQGNYRELEELAEVLDNCLGGCELNLNSIRIIPDKGESADEQLDIAELPEKWKTILFSTGVASNIATRVLAELTSTSIENAIEMVSEASKNVLQEATTADMDNAIKSLIEAFNSDEAADFYRIGLK